MQTLEVTWYRRLDTHEVNLEHFTLLYPRSSRYFLVSAPLRPRMMQGVRLYTPPCNKLGMILTISNQSLGHFQEGFAFRGLL